MRLRAVCHLIALLSVPVLAQAQDVVPVHREARHRLVLESVRFRILDVQIPAGDTTGFHLHDTAILYVSLDTASTTAQVLGGAWPATPASPPFAAVGVVSMDSNYVWQPVAHRVANAGAGTFRLLAITSAGPVSAPSMAGPQDMPGTTELRSTWFHQSRANLGPRSVTEWSVAPGPVVVVQPLAAGLAVEYEGGALHALEGAGGWWLVPPGERYRITNEGAGPAEAVAIQVR